MVRISDEHLEQGIDTVTPSPTVGEDLAAILVDEAARAAPFLAEVLDAGIQGAPGEITRMKVSLEPGA